MSKCPLNIRDSQSMLGLPVPLLLKLADLQHLIVEIFIAWIPVHNSYKILIPVILCVSDVPATFKLDLQLVRPANVNQCKFPVLI